MRLMKICIPLSVFFVLLTEHSFSQRPFIIPQPQQMKLQVGSFILDNKVVIDVIPSTDKALADIAKSLITRRDFPCYLSLFELAFATIL